MKAKYYVPDFQVLLNGSAKQDWDLRSVITSVSLTTGLEGADRVELNIANQARVWLDRSELATETPFVLKMGYLPGELVQMFAGEITGLTASFPSSGVPQLTVTAQDKRYRMKQRQQAGWQEIPLPGLGNKPRTDEQLTQQIAGTHKLQIQRDAIGNQLAAILTATLQFGMGADVDSQQKAIRKQVNETDYDLLRRVARESGLEMVIDHSVKDGGKTLKFLFPPDDIRPDLELEYGYSLIEFTPRDSSVGQVKAVSTNLRIPATGTQFGITLEVDDAQSRLSLKVDTNPVPAKKSDGSVVITEPLTPATAPRRLLGELLTRTNAKLTGSGSTIGDPRIRAGTVVCLTELGKRFGGLYRVTSATHSIDGGGYKTRFEVRKEIGLNGLSAEVQKIKAIPKPVRASS